MINLVSAFDALVPARETAIQAALGSIQHLPDLSSELERLHSEIDKEHYANFEVNFDGLSMDEQGRLELDKVKFVYTKHALAQAVSRIRPPDVVGMTSYLVACPPHIREINFNFWHQEFYGPEVQDKKSNSVMLRVKDGGQAHTFLRAIVSQIYGINDDLPVLRALQEVAPSGAHIRSARGDIKSRFDLLWPSLRHNLITGDTVLVAVRLRNSETGASNVWLEPMVYFLDDYSYFVIPRAGSEISIRHVGEARRKLQTRLPNVMNQITPFIERLDASYIDVIDQHFPKIEKLWDCLRKCYDLTKHQVDLIKIQASTGPLNQRLDLARHMLKVSSELSIEDAENVQYAASRLIEHGWGPIKKHLKDAD